MHFALCQRNLEYLIACIVVMWNRSGGALFGSNLRGKAVLAVTGSCELLVLQHQFVQQRRVLR